MMGMRKIIKGIVLYMLSLFNHLHAVFKKDFSGDILPKFYNVYVCGQ